MNSLAAEILDNFPFLEGDDVDLLLSVSIVKEIPAGTILVEEGEINANVHLVLKGLLRSYVITSAGEDRTLLISKEKMRTASFNSFLNNAPSEITIESIEPSKILVIESEKFQKLAESNKNLVLLAKEGMHLFLADAMERLHFFTVLSPEERFISFREKHPDLIQRVPQKYLASFLGVTTVSLSRIKARIAKSRR
ncbi:Crp/Fnr family transcriptional regulator [Xanthovirga aplysinae]|uniref:Crp/Fnr family transcriptional regulator n=1 Tax=Xanthovirga aplysinae TaxID=2529853 RepID=UPI0012BBF7CE|nr:Crp/Fnr family transcriptional regulator [Xanthovirga aplysinae]MTI32418.1 Crp/Fnr family transcriptional regulator [Xanthovirga aplysinae]